MAKYIVINGSTRKGNSYAIANFIKEKIDGDVEIFNIKDKEIGFCQADNAYYHPYFLWKASWNGRCFN